MKIFDDLDKFQTFLSKPMLCFLEKHIKKIKYLTIYDKGYRLGDLNFNLKNTKVSGLSLLESFYYST